MDFAANFSTHQGHHNRPLARPGAWNLKDALMSQLQHHLTSHFMHRYILPDQTVAVAITITTTITTTITISITIAIPFHYDTLHDIT